MPKSIISKKCDFTFAIHDFEQAERLKKEVYDFDIWAYIDHLPDDEDGHNHTHFYIHCKQPISIKNLSEKLDIPENFIEWVRCKTVFIQYLIHKNNPEKHQYQPENIITNDFEYINNFLTLRVGADFNMEFQDLLDLVNGRITPYQYMNNHSSQLKSLPFYSRQLFLMRLINLASQGEENRFKKYT